jgi:hypothetical protein
VNINAIVVKKRRYFVGVVLAAFRSVMTASKKINGE